MDSTIARLAVPPAERSRTAAYEMLGSAADAEDVLQETWLRWAGVDLDTVQNQRAYLVRITTRQALSRLRTLRQRKESYVGPWLPEPLLTAPECPSMGHFSAMGSISWADPRDRVVPGRAPNPRPNGIALQVIRQ